jgi:3D (Asp-Asp-Asp) domain-containing protein
MRRIATLLFASCCCFALVVGGAALGNTSDSSSARTRVMTMEVTAYCPCKKCCGPKAQGITASGRRVTHNDGLFVAADTRVLPFHTQLHIPGYANGRAVPVLDRGGAIKGRKLDVFFPSHEEALKWGRQKIEVTVVASDGPGD